MSGETVVLFQVDNTPADVLIPDYSHFDKKHLDLCLSGFYVDCNKFKRK